MGQFYSLGKPVVLVKMIIFRRHSLIRGFQVGAGLEVSSIPTLKKSIWEGRGLSHLPLSQSPIEEKCFRAGDTRLVHKAFAASACQFIVTGTHPS